MIMESLLASVIAPAVVDGAKNLIGAITKKWIGLSVDDEIKLSNAEIEKLKALAVIDNPVGSPSQWVVDLRASSRYIGVILCILSGGALMVYMPEQVEIAAQLIGIPFSFLFGERMYLGFKGLKK